MGLWSILAREARTRSLQIRLAGAYRRSVRSERDDFGVQGTSASLLLCPSYPANGHHRILGVVDEVSGDLRFVPSLGRASQVGRSLPIDWRTRFRLFGPCVKSACHHWDGGGCRLGRATADLRVGSVGDPDSCPIKGSCRWRTENGDGVCRSCPAVRYIDFRNSN